MNGDVKEIKKLSYNEFVKELVAKRKEKGFSMRNVAKRYRTSPATMVKFEKGLVDGENNTEDLKMVKMYCDLLNVEFSYLVTI